MPIAANAQTLVSTSLTGTSTVPAIFTFDSGMWAYAWVDGATIAYSVYNADGTVAVAETHIAATNPSGVNFCKHVDGGAVLTFAAQGLTVGQTDVLAIKFDAFGTADLAGASNLTNISGNEVRPAMTMLPDGTMVVTWADSSNSDAIMMRLVNPALAVSPTITVATGSITDGPNSTVAALESGSFVVLYEKGVSGSTEIMGKIYTADGVVEVNEFQINVTTANNQMDPEVIALANGGFVAMWNSGNGTTVNGRVFNSSGVALANDFQINSLAMSGLAGGSQVTGTQLADGTLVFVWEALTAGSREIRGRLFDANGTPNGADFQVNTIITGNQTNPSVAAHPDGTFTVTWQNPDGVENDIYSRKFDPSLFSGGVGADVYSGLNVADVIYGLAGNDTLNGRGGNDTIYGGDNNDVIDGGDGDDILYGDAGNDTIDGGAGNDKLFAGAAGSVGNNTLRGGDGDDILYAGAGLDKFDGGGGTDTVSFYYGGAMSIDMNVGSTTASILVGGAAAGDTFSGTLKPENIDGSATGADFIRGSSTINVLRGFGGADNIEGMGGNDTIYGGSGNDLIAGGDDNDTLFGDAGNDTILGGNGNDTVTSGAGADTNMDGGADIDTLTYFDEVTGATISLGGGVGSGSAAGDSVVADTFENLFGSNIGGDTLTGTNGVNNLRGFGGADVLNGLGGNDTLEGGLGNDTLNGGDGDDLLSGGGGDDTFFGGLGKDTYTANASGIDTYNINSLADFTLGRETINTMNFNEDKFVFEDDNFTGLDATLNGGLVTAAMILRTTDGSHVATTVDHRFIFDDVNNSLWYDNDGSGAVSSAVELFKFSLHTGTFDQDIFVIG